MSSSDDNSARKRLGDFEIIREIGRGGMGVVFEARQVSLNRPIALKVLSSALGLTHQAVIRFRREAETAAKLHHTNIVPIYATGDENGAHFYAMELILGPSLDQVLRQIRRSQSAQLPASEGSASSAQPSAAELPDWVAQTIDWRGGRAAPSLGTAADRTNRTPTDSGGTTPSSSSLSSGSGYFDAVARMIAEVADALDYAHRNGVIHRDMKPSNLLLSPDGRLSINDFGLARMLEQTGMTMTGEFVGTPSYMSPEQITAGRVPIDHRTDIYSLGATLYEMLTLRPPFPGERRDQVLAQILQKEPTPPRKLNRKVPIDLETICLKAMDKDPDRRYQTGGQLAEDLRRYTSRFAILARRSGPVERLVKWTRRHPALAAAVTCAVLAVASTGYFAWQARQTRINAALETALVAAMSGDLDGAEEKLAEAEKFGSTTGESRMVRGLVLLHRGDSPAAIVELKRAVEQMPQCPAAYYLLLYAYVDNGQWEDVGDVERRAEGLPLLTPQDHLFKARFDSIIDPKAARRKLDEFQRQQRRSTLGRIVRAEVLFNQAQLTASMSDAQAAVAAADEAEGDLPDNPVPLFLGVSSRLTLMTAFEEAPPPRLAEREEVLREAEQRVRRLADFPQAPCALWTRVNFLEYTDRLAEALAVMDQSNSKYRLTVYYKVNLLYRAGRFEEALACLQTHESLHTDVNLLLGLGFVQAALGNEEQAHEAYRNGIRLSKGGVGSLYPHAILLLMGRKEMARQGFQKVRSERRMETVRDNWYPKLWDYNCGDMSQEQLLAAAGDSRLSLAEANFFIGLTQLADGHREGARDHFLAAQRARVFMFGDYWWSRAFLARMEADPAWPRQLNSPPTLRRPE